MIAEPTIPRCPATYILSDLFIVQIRETIDCIESGDERIPVEACGKNLESVRGERVAQLGVGGESSDGSGESIRVGRGDEEGGDAILKEFRLGAVGGADLSATERHKPEIVETESLAFDRGLDAEMRIEEEFAGVFGGDSPVDHLNNAADHGPTTQGIEVIGESVADDSKPEFKVAEADEGVDSRFKTASRGDGSAAEGNDRALCRDRSGVEEIAGNGVKQDVHLFRGDRASFTFPLPGPEETVAGGPGDKNVSVRGGVDRVEETRDADRAERMAGYDQTDIRTFGNFSGDMGRESVAVSVGVNNAGADRDVAYNPDERGYSRGVG